MAIDLSKPIGEIEQHEPTGPILERPDHDLDEDLELEPGTLTTDLGDDD